MSRPVTFPIFEDMGISRNRETSSLCTSLSLCFPRFILSNAHILDSKRLSFVKKSPALYASTTPLYVLHNSIKISYESFSLNIFLLNFQYQRYLEFSPNSRVLFKLAIHTLNVFFSLPMTFSPMSKRDITCLLGHGIFVVMCIHCGIYFSR